MTHPPRRHYSNPATLDVLGEKVEANADQVGALTAQMSKLADQVSQLTTAIGVANANTSNLTDRLETLERRSDEQSERKEQHTFQLSQNTIGWMVAVAMLVFNAIISGNIRIGR